jgi:hypothetical protein
MVLVRNIFRLKFGTAREGIAALKESIAVAPRLGHPGTFRLLSDVSGDFYTLVLEVTYPDLGSMEQTAAKVFGQPQWEAVYRTFVPLVDSGRREIFTIVEP